MCEFLSVHRSSYYYWFRGKDCEDKDTSLIESIRESHRVSRGIYGSCGWPYGWIVHTALPSTANAYGAKWKRPGYSLLRFLRHSIIRRCWSMEFCVSSRDCTERRWKRFICTWYKDIIVPIRRLEALLAIVIFIIAVYKIPYCFLCFCPSFYQKSYVLILVDNCGKRAIMSISKL